MSEETVILAVDDSPEALDLLVKLLTPVGYRVRPADSGELALAAVAVSPPDLILLDIKMKGLDGLEVCRRLKAGVETRNIPVILMSAYAETKDWAAGLQLGAVDFVSKPFQPEELLARIRTQLSLRHASVALERQAAVFRQANVKLQGEIAVRQHVEDELRHGLELAERSRRALLSALEDHGKAEEALRESEQKFALAFQTAPYAIAITRIEDGQFMEVNDAFCAITGYSREEALAGTSVGLGIWADPNDRTRVVKAIRAGKSVFREELLFRTKKGEVVTGLFTAKVIRLRSGPCILSSIEDISDRKRTEVELKLRNLILSTQQEASIDGILVVDVEGTFVSSNRRFADIWAVPRSFLEMPSDDHVLMAVREKLADPDAFVGKLIHLHANPAELSHDEVALKDGRTLDSYSAPMRDSDGRHFGRVWFFRDISARKRGEEEREEIEAQLRMSQRLEAVGKLAGGIAHDFNNLLSVILSYTGFALERVQSGDPLEEDLLEVKRSGERAAGLTRQLLAFSRKQVLQPESLNLNLVAAGVEKMLRRVLGEDIDFVQRLAPDLGVIHADPGQMEQVLMNLVVNARDAMPEGGKLTIETCNVEIDEEYAARHVTVAPGPYVQLSVSDTGSGMDEQTKSRLFEPFFTTKPKGKGTGLGLSTVYGIVKQSGGNVWVYSELGRGTTFKVFLPRDPSAATSVVVNPPAVPSRSTGSETIMLVEDEEALRKVAKRMLDANGYRVLAAAGGEEAIRTAAQHEGEIQLLLTDVVMAGMGGRALAHELLKARPELKILYMSGYTDDAIVHHGVLEAGTHFLAKPFTAPDLLRKVREVLDGVASRNVYPSVAAVEPEAAMEQPLDKDALGALPREVVDGLCRAVVAARFDEIVELIESIGVADPVVAGGLRRMADRFEYEAMRALLSR